MGEKGSQSAHKNNLNNASAVKDNHALARTAENNINNESSVLESLAISS